MAAEIDDIDLHLLQILCKNSRTTASDLGNSVGLTRQAVTDRLDRLRASGVIHEFTLSLSPERLGFPVRAFIAITLMPGCSATQEHEVISALAENPYVQECYRMTGEDIYQIRLVIPSVALLKEVIAQLRATPVVQSTRTTIALETLFEKSALSLPLKISPQDAQGE